MTKLIVPYTRIIPLLAIVSILPLGAWAQDASSSSGAINTHVRQQMYWQQNAPYMFRPITESDLKPGPPDDEPSVLYSDQEVQGKVLPSVPSPNDIHVK